ncbi:MAG TPA: hypothetical protein VGE41_01995, partial [Verrucomicrobiae bacterium]
MPAAQVPTKAYLRAFVWVSLVSFLCLSSQAQFIAFNDHAPGAGTSSNSTTWSVQTNVGTANPLRDINTGNNLGVTLTFRTNANGLSNGMGVFFASTADNPASGTPAYTNFNGYVDFAGLGTSSVELRGATAAVTNLISGVDPTKTYAIRATAVRGG